MSGASDEAVPMPFQAVGGHKSSIFYGDVTQDGKSTLQKSTTAWEILYYLAMELAKEDAFARSEQREDDATRTKFIHAAGKLSAFAPQLFSLRFPEKFAPVSAAVQEKMHLAENNVVRMEAGAPGRALLLPLFNELFDGVEGLAGFDEAYDTGIWGIGLVDETSGMTRPCVMDVKIGYIRHSPLTPADKVARMLKKEGNSLMRDTALRICGCQRYIHISDEEEGEGQAPSCERFGKEIGYAVATVPELSSCLKLFFSGEESLAEEGPDSTLAFFPAALEAVTAGEQIKMAQRITAVQADASAILHFLEESESGAFLMQNFAFVSTSVLLAYDEAANPATARLRFIDFARSTWRKFNFDEPTVGFVQGLKNLDAYLA